MEIYGETKVKLRNYKENRRENWIDTIGLMVIFMEISSIEMGI